MADPPQHAIVPIDECYRLVGTGQGRAGRGSPAAQGPEEAIAAFFEDLRSQDAAGHERDRRRRKRRRADKGSAAQAARAVADAATETSQPTDRPVPEFEVVGVEPRRACRGPDAAVRGRGHRADRPHRLHVALTAMIEIEPSKRRYDDAERERLVELFGEPERWASTTSSFRWAQAEVLVPSFTGLDEVRRSSCACTYDLEVGGSQVLRRARQDGEAPLRFHFNGTVFYEADDGRMQLIQVPWDCSARFRDAGRGLAAT